MSDTQRPAFHSWDEAVDYVNANGLSPRGIVPSGVAFVYDASLVPTRDDDAYFGGTGEVTLDPHTVAIENIPNPDGSENTFAHEVLQ